MKIHFRASGKNDLARGPLPRAGFRIRVSGLGFTTGGLWGLPPQRHATHVFLFKKSSRQSFRLLAWARWSGGAGISISVLGAGKRDFNENPKQGTPRI